MKSTEEIIKTLRNFDEWSLEEIREAADRLEELSRWIPITEARPPTNKDVLFFCLNDGWQTIVRAGWWDGDKTNGAAIVMNIGPGTPEWWYPCTHWRPFPELPEVKE